jgi:hypothetical protein
MSFSFKVRGIRESFDKSDKELNSAINSIARVEALNTLQDIKEATPVDTGRARNSWILTKNKRNFTRTGQGQLSIGALGPVPDDKIETLYITNGVPYIDKLNAGSSSQAPARFIERQLLKTYTPDGVLFETLNDN